MFFIPEVTFRLLTLMCTLNMINIKLFTMIIVIFNPKDKLSLSNLQWTFYGFYQSMFASERTSPCCNIVTAKKLVIVGNAFAKN